jgi:aldehyde dehydrogenase (NAD+)
MTAWPDPTVPTVSGAAATVARLREAFDAGRTLPASWRREQLEGLKALLKEQEHELLEALRADLGKPATEALVTDLSFVRVEAEVALRELGQWMRPERVPVPMVQRPGRARILRQPLGVVLVIAPWNYPVNLLLAPVVGALAAGNCVVAKPSELAPVTSAALARLVPRYLDPEAVAVVEGGAEEAQALLAQRFDHIFYTGSARVARVVMEAAACHLTPVTLELGGKSPALVDAGADLEVAARRIAWGKLMNAGQTCVAPDYVLVHREGRDRLVEALGRAIHRFYGKDPAQSPDYARIVNDRHWLRLHHLLESTGARVALGGAGDRQTRYLSPTVLTDVSPDDPVMEEEIFGPILPLVEVKDLDQAASFVASRPSPLALYIFSGSDAGVERVLERTSSGGVCVNGTVLHLAVPGLPFGGVGESGIGAYHGRSGFETFSHRRSVLAKPGWPDPPLAYPPYSRLRSWILRRALTAR